MGRLEELLGEHSQGLEVTGNGESTKALRSL